MNVGIVAHTAQSPDNVLALTWLRRNGFHRTLTLALDSSNLTSGEQVRHVDGF